MSEKNLAIIATPLFFAADPLMIQNLQIYTKLMKKLVKYSYLLSKFLPSHTNYVLFPGPDKISDHDWSILMTNSSIEEFTKGEQIHFTDDRMEKIYYVANGVIGILKNNKTLTMHFSGEYICDLPSLSISESVYAFEQSKIIKLSVPFLIGLFQSNQKLFYSFYWHQTKLLAKRLKELPLLNENKEPFTTSTSIQSETTKIEIFFPDHTSRWLDFSSQSTVYQMLQELRKSYPKYGKRSTYLVETSHGRDICKLQNEWTVEELLIRAKYACDYKIMYMNDNLNQSGAKKLSARLASSRSGDSSSITHSSTISFCEDTIIIQQFPCKRRKKHGTLYILQNGILHVAKLFGLNSKKMIFFNSISNIVKTKNVLTFSLKEMNKKSNFYFDNEIQCVDALRIIHSLSDIKLHSPIRRVSNSLEFSGQQLGIVLKRHKILKPALIDLKPGDIIKITPYGDNNYKDEICGEFKDIPISIPSDNIELLPLEVNSPLLIVEELKEDVSYFGLEQLPSKNDWATLLLHGKRVQFNKGDVIVPEGSTLQSLYQIESGYCSVYTTVPKNEGDDLSKKSERWKLNLNSINSKKSIPYTQLKLQTLSKGETFGDIGLFTHEGAIASVVADGGMNGSDITTVFLIEAPTLSALFDKNPKIGARFAKYMHGILKKRIQFEVSNRYEDTYGK